MKLKGKKISEVPQKSELNGEELIPFAQNNDNGSVTVDTLAKYAYDKEGGDFTSRLAYDVQVPGIEFIADRAEKDASGNIITDTYITRSTAKNAMTDALKEQLPNAIKNIKEGLITPDMLSEETKQLFGAEKIINFPDNEDIIVNSSEQLTFADKSYNPIIYSGMGCKRLRKHMVNGVNTLTQNIFSDENTRYIIQYEYDLQGNTVTIPEWCILDFQGGRITNGNIILANTLLLGHVSFSESCAVSGSCSNRSILVDWFGAKNDGVSDNTNVIKNVIKLAYNSTEHSNSSFNKVSPIIEFGYGVYLVKSTLIDENSSLKYGSFIFRGDGIVGTTIKYLGGSDSYLFYNKEIFAYTEFNNIKFVGNDDNRFMYLYSSASTGSIVQSITFNACRFAQFKNITTCEGNTMCSEVSFNMCKVVYFPNTESELFVFNNLQALNWRFYGTDIEQTRGTIFKILQGVYISMYSCSIIPFEGTVISVPSTADKTQFWLTNTPSVAMYSCRFEIRDHSQLLNINSNAYLQFIFNTCSMGGFNISDTTDIYTIDITSPNNINQVKLIFNDCSNFLKYRYKVIGNNNSYSGWVESYFNNCIVDINAILSKSMLPLSNDMPAAPEGSPKFFINGEYISYMSDNSVRNGMSPVNYIGKSKTNQHLTSNLAAGGKVTFDNSNFFKINSYVGGITLNIRPSTDVYINIVNSEGTIIYGRFTIKAWTYFNQTIYVGKRITEEDYVIMTITNKSETTTAYIEGFCEITTSVQSYHTLTLANKLSELNIKQNGLMAYHDTHNMPVVWDGNSSCWRDANGFRTIDYHKGDTNSRPTPNTADIGYIYFDTDLNKPIWWVTNRWVDANGDTV